MSLVSFEFILFVAITFLINFLTKDYLKKLIMLIASGTFIVIYGNYYHGLWLLLAVLYSYLGSLVLNKYKNKTVLFMVLVPILFSLMFFKYNYLFQFKNIIMPVGISFYTFKMISYLVDLYHGKVELPSIIDYAIYIGFFPTITAGPIHRSASFFKQLNEKMKWEYIELKNAAIQCALGMFQKIVFADYLAYICNIIFSSKESSSTMLIFGMVLYSFQLYIDFDGYSNIVIGISKLFGFKMERNFYTPYLSASIMEFWDRWHCSLSSWLKDYIYIPLGGNRKGKIRKYINVCIVFIISGLWHGSTLMFLLWGLGHGLVNIIENILKDLFGKKKAVEKQNGIQRMGSFWIKVIKILINFTIVTILWLFFRSSSMTEMIDLIRRMLNLNSLGLNYKALGITIREMIWLLIIILITIMTDIFRNKEDMIVWLSKRNSILRWCFYTLLIFMVIVFGMYGPGYGSSEFIYATF